MDPAGDVAIGGRIGIVHETDADPVHAHVVRVPVAGVLVQDDLRVAAAGEHEGTIADDR